LCGLRKNSFAALHKSRLWRRPYYECSFAPFDEVNGALRMLLPRLPLTEYLVRAGSAKIPLLHCTKAAFGGGLIMSAALHHLTKSMVHCGRCFQGFLSQNISPVRAPHKNSRLSQYCMSGVAFYSIVCIRLNRTFYFGIGHTRLSLRIFHNDFLCRSFHIASQLSEFRWKM